MKAPEQKKRDPVPAGPHKAICYCVCDLGTQDVTYPGKPPQATHQILLQWELPDCRMDFEEDGEKVSKPRVIGMTYTFSSYIKANLAQHVISWTGGCDDDFDYESLVGKPCLLNVVHQKAKSSNNTYAKIAAVMPLPSGMTTDGLENPTIFYDIQAMGSKLPMSLQGDNYKWLRERIEESNEFAMMKHASGVLNGQQQQEYDGAAPVDEDTTDYGDGDPDDNIPF